MESLRKKIELMLVFLKGPVFVLYFFLLYINELPDYAVCNIATYADDTTLYSNYDQASDLWQQLGSASELESGLRDIAEWDRNRLVDFNAGKPQRVLLDRFTNSATIDVKMDGLALEEKLSFKMLRLSLSFKLDWGCYIFPIAKTASKNIGALIHSMKFLCPEATLFCVNMPYGLAWNTVAISGLELLVATWIC